MRRGLTAVGLLVLPVLVVLGLAPAPPTTSALGTVPLAATTLVCPVVPDPQPGRSTRLTVAALGGPRTPRGEVSVSGLESPTVSSGASSGPALVTDLPALAGGGAVLTATGSLAAGTEAEVVTRSDTPEDRGLAGTRCVAPRREWWFLGASTELQVSSTLHLVNPAAGPALVDVTLLTGAGLVTPRALQGLRVAAGGRLDLDLGEVAPAEPALGVHVDVRVGQVAAGVRLAIGGSTPEGSEWLPAIEAPATDLVLPGVPGGRGSRRLLLANPAQQDLAVTVELRGAEPGTGPDGLEPIVVPAGHSTTVDLTDRLDGQPAGVVVGVDEQAGGPAEASPGPSGVLAAVRLADVADGPLADVALVGPAPVLEGRTLVTNIGDVNRKATLYMTDTGGDGSVTLVARRGGTASGAPVRVALTAGTTTSVDLNAAFPDPVDGVVVIPTPGTTVSASRYLRETTPTGTFATSLPLVNLPVAVPRRAVQPDAGAANPS